MQHNMEEDNSVSSVYLMLAVRLASQHVRATLSAAKGVIVR